MAMTEMNDGLTPGRDKETTIPLAADEKKTLDQVLRAYPDHRPAYSILERVLAEAGDSRVTFTGGQVSFICDKLIPWAIKDSSLMWDPRFAFVERQNLELIASKLRPPEEVEGEVIGRDGETAFIRLQLPGQDDAGFGCPVQVLRQNGVDIDGGRVICTLTWTIDGTSVTAIRRYPDESQCYDAALPAVEELPPDLEKALKAVWEKAERDENKG